MQPFTANKPGITFEQDAVCLSRGGRIKIYHTANLSDGRRREVHAQCRLDASTGLAAGGPCVRAAARFACGAVAWGPGWAGGYVAVRVTGVDSGPRPAEFQELMVTV